MLALHKKKFRLQLQFVASHDDSIHAGETEKFFTWTAVVRPVSLIWTHDETDNGPTTNGNQSLRPALFTPGAPSATAAGSRTLVVFPDAPGCERSCAVEAGVRGKRGAAASPAGPDALNLEIGEESPMPGAIEN